MAAASVESVQARVDDVTNVMQQNVTIMVDNIDKTSVLEDKSKNLANQASAFHKTAKSTRKHFWWQLCKQRLVLAGCFILAIAMIVILITANTGGGGGGGGDGGSTLESGTSTREPGATSAASSRANVSVVYAETFDDDDESPPPTPAPYRDRQGFRCAHELTPEAGARAIAEVGNLSTFDLGFSSYYVDSLGANGSAPLHAGKNASSSAVTSAGAAIGVEEVDGREVYALRGAGTDGYLFVCSRPLWVAAAVRARAEAVIYVAQAGWHEDEDELRAWADVTPEAAATQHFSLLPNCSATVKRANIDTLGLRDSSTPGVAYSGAPSAPGDPALLPDLWQWRTLGVHLGARESAAEIRVCVGLQSGAGAEAVFVDELRIREAHGESDLSPRAGCAPSAALVGVSSFASLAAPGSCDVTRAAGGEEAGAIAGQSHSAGASSALVVTGVILTLGAIALVIYVAAAPKGGQAREAPLPNGQVREAATAGVEVARTNLRF